MIAARSVHAPEASAQTPLPGAASTVSRVLLTLNVAPRAGTAAAKRSRRAGRRMASRFLAETSFRATILPMHVEVRKVDDVVIVDLQGRLLAGVGDEILRNVVNELLAEGWKKILLNLSGV